VTTGVQRACVEPDCGELFQPTQREASRCPVHARDHERETEARYPHRWRVFSRECIRRQPWCTDCGTTLDLTTDHMPGAHERVRRRLPLRPGVDGEVVCRSCNARRGPAEGRARGGEGLPDGDRSPTAFALLPITLRAGGGA
jgi:hypothetical protein